MRKENHSQLGSQLPDIATLNRRITLQSFTTSRDLNGAEVLTWITSWTDWTKVEQAKTGSDEAFLGDQIIVTTRKYFTLRYRGTTTEKMRFLYNSEVYDILFIEELGNKRFEKFTCEKRT